MWLNVLGSRKMSSGVLIPVFYAGLPTLTVFMNYSSLLIDMRRRRQSQATFRQALRSNGIDTPFSPAIALLKLQSASKSTWGCFVQRTTCKEASFVRALHS